MDSYEILNKLERILEDSKAAILASNDEEGKPHTRWLMPALLKGREGAIFAISSPSFKWVQALKKYPDVHWMIQTRSLDEIVNVKGKVTLVDNPSLKAEVVQTIGNKLTVFWKVNTKAIEFTVIETAITEISYFKPMKGEKVVVPWAREIKQLP